MGNIVILTHCEYYFIRVHENIVQLPSNNLSIKIFILFSWAHFCFDLANTVFYFVYRAKYISINIRLKLERQFNDSCLAISTSKYIKIRSLNLKIFFLLIQNNGVQTFSPMILIYRRGTFVYYNCGCVRIVYCHGISSKISKFEV